MFVLARVGRCDPNRARSHLKTYTVFCSLFVRFSGKVTDYAMNISTETSHSSRFLTSLYSNCARTVAVVPQDLPPENGRREKNDGESDFGALVYIVVVLVFYSAGSCMLLLLWCSFLFFVMLSLYMHLVLRCWLFCVHGFVYVVL